MYNPLLMVFDAFLTRKVLLNDVSFIPSVFQAVAMDVNMDGVISAGDLSQINQRAVLMIPEFKQQWNYDLAGNHIPGTGPSKDWLFIDQSTITSNPLYSISTTYPNNDGWLFEIAYTCSNLSVYRFRFHPLLLA